MGDTEKLYRLASLIHQRNSLDAMITAVIGRPTLAGHFGEFVAAEIFDVKLHQSAANKGNDGLFARGSLSGKTVEIKYYPRNEGILDMKLESLPDLYLVLTGPRTAAGSSRGQTRAWIIEAVYLFDAVQLTRSLQGRKIGTATSVRRELWDEAEVYPNQNNKALELTSSQQKLLALFSKPSGDTTEV